MHGCFPMSSDGSFISSMMLMSSVCLRSRGRGKCVCVSRRDWWVVSTVKTQQ